MPDHVQPTPEELAAQLKKTQEALDAPEVPEQEVEEEVVETKPVEETVVTEEPTEETPIETTEEVVVEEKKESTTEDRYKESTREAQRLYRNNAKMNEAIADANALPEPTVDELKKEYPEWEEMSDVERRLSVEVFVNKRFREHINTVSAEQRNIDQWVDKVGKFADDPKTFIEYPDLEGKVEAFRKYADDKKLVGTDFGVLVGGFLYEQGKSKVKHTGKMMETGKGGDKKAVKTMDDKLSVADASNLMKTDYKKYKELLVAGKIQMSVE